MGSVRPLPIMTVHDPDVLDDVGQPPAGVEVRLWDVVSPAREALGGDVDRVVATVLPYGSRATLEHLADLPALRLVQVLSAGVDSVVGRLPDGVVLANGAGVHEASTAELALGLVLSSLRGIDEAVRDQAQGRWRPVARTSLADRRVLVLGVGRIGDAVADRLAPFEVELTRVATTARDDERGHVHSVDELPALLPGAEVVVLVLPLTEATRGLVDAAFLDALPTGALLVNVGRGAVVDTDALVAAVRDRRVRAALDVVDPEPLPPEHPLWGLDGVIITPHVGGGASAMRPRATALLRTQLRRLADGGEPVNVVPAR